MRENDWLICYVDGRKWTPRDGPVVDAPKDRVLYVKNKGYRALHGAAYFVYDAERNYWYNCDFAGRESRLKTRPLVTVTFWGECVPDDDWKLILHEMKHGK